MRTIVLSSIAIASFCWTSMSSAQLNLRPQEVSGPEFDIIDQDAPQPVKTGTAFYVSCTFMANAPEGTNQPVIPLMFAVNTSENRQVPPNDQPVTRSFAQTFDVIQDPRGLFYEKGQVTVIDRRPVYMLLEWEDSPGRQATLLLPYAGVISGPHRIAGLLGHGHLGPSFDPKDWKVIPGGTLEHTMRAKCNAFQTTRGSVMMGAAK